MIKTALVTGAGGFIGKNLINRLEQQKDIEILSFDINTDTSLLYEYASRTDIVFHLAGVNRSDNPLDFDIGNREFTSKLCDILKETSRVPVIMSSSIQAALDNPYGVSKRGAEELLERYGRECGCPIYIFRLQNCFGKWCRPNYNSVVATFCYNIANGLPVAIDNPDKELDLVYIDDVIDAFIDASFNRKVQSDKDGFCMVKSAGEITVGLLADKIRAFNDSSKNLILPSFESYLDRCLYAVYLSYLPPDNLANSLDMKVDSRGFLAEFIKSESAGQVFVSLTKPGVTRGRHFHNLKVEKFLVVAGEGLIRLRALNGGEITEFRVCGNTPEVVNIPPGYTHSITNCGGSDLVTLFWSDEIFDPDRPDTFYAEV